MELNWYSPDFWRTEGHLRIPTSGKCIWSIIASLFNNDGEILYVASLYGPKGLRDETFEKEINNLRWVPENLNKARALIEMVVRMEGYDGS